jgi:DNA helicase-2/ATP-dependent DNA helicase PcrA
VYRSAWAALAGVPESSVRTAFYYVRARTTVIPEELPSVAEVAGLLTVADGEAAPRCDVRRPSIGEAVAVVT